MGAKLKCMWQDNSLQSSYDAVIIGGGIHGCATAYYLAKEQGMKNIALIERTCVGYGGSGRNTAIVRANQRTQANLRLHKEGLELWPVLTKELNFNLMFNQSGHLSLAHSESTIGAFRINVSSAQLSGVDCRFIDARECKELVPAINLSRDITHPVYGGIYSPPGGVLRHDAVMWALARGAAQHGAHIHEGVEVTGIDVSNNKITGVRTTRGKIKTPNVIVAAGGYSVQLADMVGIKLPVHPLTIQAMVTQPLKPFLDLALSSGAYDIYITQTLKGEIASGAHMDEAPNFTSAVTSLCLKHQAEMLTELLPCMKGARFMRIWAGLADMAPDMAPIVFGNDEIQGFYFNGAWGYYGFKSGPIVGKYMAQFVATGETPGHLEQFTNKRFAQFRYTGEKAIPAEIGPWN